MGIIILFRIDLSTDRLLTATNFLFIPAEYNDLSMSYMKPENFRQPEFCEDCPAVADMEQIEVRKTNNFGPMVNTVYAGNMPSEKQLYVHDPEKPEAGAVILGEDYLTDPFCGCHETAQSRALGETHERLEACEGPTEETSWFGLKKTAGCGAGFRNNKKFIDALNKCGEEYPNLVTVVGVQPRKAKTTTPQPT